MTRFRLLMLLAALAITSSVARADMGFFPIRRGNPYAEKDETPKPLPPRKTSLCGSGAGLGLAAIGAAWGLMWVGRRVPRNT